MSNKKLYTIKPLKWVGNEKHETGLTPQDGALYIVLRGKDDMYGYYISNNEFIRVDYVGLKHER